jgi:hypothetical protein
MPFGLCGASATFQHMMDTVFTGTTRLTDGTSVNFLQFVALYLDDICIYSQTALDHVMHVVAVLTQVPAYSLYV